MCLLWIVLKLNGFSHGCYNFICRNILSFSKYRLHFTNFLINVIKSHLRGSNTICKNFFSFIYSYFMKNSLELIWITEREKKIENPWNCVRNIFINMEREKKVLMAVIVVDFLIAHHFLQLNWSWIVIKTV